MSRSLRESSLQVYESHWGRFVHFCRSKRWHVFRVRSHHFSTYMMNLFRDGYCFQWFDNHTQYKRDLHLVLSALMSPPFVSEFGDQGEISDGIIPLKWQTMETATVFLLALALVRRRSYIHVLSVAPGRCVFSQGNSQRQLVVSLMQEAGFLAKNQLPSLGHRPSNGSPCWV